MIDIPNENILLNAFNVHHADGFHDLLPGNSRQDIILTGRVDTPSLNEKEIRPRSLRHMLVMIEHRLINVVLFDEMIHSLLIILIDCLDRRIVSLVIKSLDDNALSVHLFSRIYASKKIPDYIQVRVRSEVPFDAQIHSIDTVAINQILHQIQNLVTVQIKIGKIKPNRFLHSVHMFFKI